MAGYSAGWGIQAPEKCEGHHQSIPPAGRTQQQAMRSYWVMQLRLFALVQKLTLINVQADLRLPTQATSWFGSSTQPSKKKVKGKKKTYENRLFILQKAVCLFYPSVFSLTTGYCCSFCLLCAQKNFNIKPCYNHITNEANSQTTQSPGTLFKRITSHPVARSQK